MDASRLRECLRSGQYSLFDKGLVLRQRADRRNQLRWYQESTGNGEKTVAEQDAPACVSRSAMCRKSLISGDLTANGVI